MIPCVFRPRDTYWDIVTLPDQLRLICSICNTDICYFPLWVQGAKQLILSSSCMLTWLHFCDNHREISKGVKRSRAKRGLGWRVRSKLKGRYWAIYEVFQGLSAFFCLPPLMKFLCLSPRTPQSTSAQRCPNTLHYCFLATSEPRRQGTKDKEESSPDSGFPSPTGPRIEH